MSNQIQRIDTDSAMPAVVSESATILSVIQRAAADPQCDIEKMERLMAMHERMQSRNAETAFNASMAEMQIELPSIAERGKTNNGKYATLEDINDVVKPIMQRFGFALSFRVEHTQGGIKVTGILMHRAGHREETTMLLPSDTSGSKNAVQAVGSSVSYGKRYVMNAMLNITTRGEDDDGYAAAPTATITAPQAAQVAALLQKCSDKAKAAFEAMHGAPEHVSKAEFDKVMAALSKSAAKHAQEAGSADHHAH